MQCCFIKFYKTNASKDEKYASGIYPVPCATLSPRKEREKKKRKRKVEENIMPILFWRMNCDQKPNYVAHKGSQIREITFLYVCT